MNTKGHTKTLVAAHPGNRNAVKSGVFSPATLAPRVHEAELALREQRPEDAARDFLRRELAGLGVLRDAMDEELAAGGIRGRTGEPRTLINLRLRLNERLRRTVADYAALETPALPIGEVAAAAEGAKNPSVSKPAKVADLIAEFHDRESIAELRPAEVDPQGYLTAVVVTRDPEVTVRDKRRARAMLNKVERPPGCSCCFTRRARDALEFRSWIDEAREAGSKPAKVDEELAAQVRQAVAGELEPPFLYRRFVEAVRDVVAGKPDEPWKVAEKLETRAKVGPTITPFWEVALSPDPKLAPADRLAAFAALLEASALPQCTCNSGPKLRLWEDKADAARAVVIRLLAENHRRAALHIAHYPKTFLALRDAMDARVVADLSSSAEERPQRRNKARKGATKSAAKASKRS